MSSRVSPIHKSPSSGSKLDNKGTVGPETKTFLNAKGKRIFSSYWRPQGKIRAIVYICHGFAEHLQWYEELALKFTAQGCLAFGHDHVGHGRSEGTRGHIDDVQDYVDDVLQHCDTVRQAHSGQPVYMIAHSMGGLIALRTVIARPHYFKGVLLMGPLIKPPPNEATPTKIFFAKLVAKILPFLTVSKLSLDHVTRDQEMKTRMEKDPLRYHGGILCRWGVAVAETLKYIEHHMDDVNVPFKILHGDKDLLCDIKGSEALFARAKSKDKSFKIYPGAFHHLYCETPEVRQEAMTETVDWIMHRVTQYHSTNKSIKGRTPHRQSQRHRASTRGNSHINPYDFVVSYDD